ncbi:MAG: transglutaminase-like domain-containing protein [Chloroflexota bacterium]
MEKEDPGFWRKLSLGVSLALVIALVATARLWSELNALKTRPAPAAPENVAGSAGQKESPNVLPSYAELRGEINRRLGIGEDAISFVTPQSPAVTAAVKEITSGYKENSSEFWRDCDNIFRWVTQNVSYSPDTYTLLVPESPDAGLKWVDEFWRTPEETLKDKAGDCEDLSVLLASMLLNYNEGRYSVWVVVIGNEAVSHIAVALPVAGKMLTIMDPTAFYITGPTGSVLSSREVDVAVKDWLSHWEEKMPGARIKAVFNNEFYKDFLSTQAFINWANKEID